MEIGMLIRWGGAVQGREQEHIENYRRSVAYGQRMVAEGKLTFFEPFLFSGGDVEVEEGFFVIKGQVADVFAILEGDEYRDLFARASLTAQHLHAEMLTVGEGIERQITDYEKARREVGV